MAKDAIKYIYLNKPIITLIFFLIALCKVKDNTFIRFKSKKHSLASNSKFFKIMFYMGKGLLICLLIFIT